jgi:hypothetical protein
MSLSVVRLLRTSKRHAAIAGNVHAQRLEPANYLEQQPDRMPPFDPSLRDGDGPADKDVVEVSR